MSQQKLTDGSQVMEYLCCCSVRFQIPSHNSTDRGIHVGILAQHEISAFEEQAAYKSLLAGPQCGLRLTAHAGQPRVRVHF